MSTEKSSCTPGFFSFDVTEQISFREVVAAYLPSPSELQRTSFFNNFSQSEWTFWTQDMIWLAYVFYGWNIDFKRHFNSKPFWFLNDFLHEAVSQKSEVLCY